MKTLTQQLKYKRRFTTYATLIPHPFVQQRRRHRAPDSPRPDC
jgi:hypothetical protein